MITRLRRLLRDERGDIEDLPAWTILTIISVALLSAILVFGRAGVVEKTVQAAAAAAARDASLSRGGDAVPHAISAARIAMGSNVTCTSLDVRVYGNGLSTGLGQAGTVSAEVTCTVSYGDLVFPGMNLPGFFTVKKTATSPVDPYRQR
ncbi:hypothetical protein [Microbacterium panaciterrae]|uniref:Pilus assembly protein n=1 Tax=Microbacterium panaciterrae TaxID=985759 RepID=A0ABP8PE39_9MICO